MQHERCDRTVAEVLSFLAALYPRFELTRATIRAYEEVLADLPPDLLKAAARHAGSRSTFFPAAAELRQAAFALQMAAQAAPDPYEAWAQVRGHFNGQRVPLHPLAQQVIDLLGGLEAFGQSERREEPSWRARFVDAYKELVLAEAERMRMLPAVRETVASLPASAGEEA